MGWFKFATTPMFQNVKISQNVANPSSTFVFSTVLGFSQIELSRIDFIVINVGATVHLLLCPEIFGWIHEPKNVQTTSFSYHKHNRIPNHGDEIKATDGM